MIVLLSALQAHAWEHSGFVWELQDAPLRVLVDPTMPDAEAWRGAFQDAADAWAATPTALTLSVEMADSGPLSWNSSPGNILVFRDLDGVTGTFPAVTSTIATGVVAYTNAHGATYLYVDEADIRIKGNTTFVDIDEPCGGTDNIRQSVAVHELGHALGMDHSPFTTAVMYWDDSGCTANHTPTADDLEGLGQLYDASGDWTVSSGGSIGETPREVCFAIAPNGIDADRVAWDFGDGATGEGDETCHTFEEPGAFDVEAISYSEPDDDAPRSSSGTVFACSTPPGPIAGADHLFEVDTIGTQIEILPTVDAQLPCVESLRWSVLRDGETLYELPTSMSLVDVGEYGEYTVILRTSGYGGVAEEEQTVTLSAPAAEEDAGPSCTTLAPRGGLALLGLVIAALARRRIGAA